MRLKLMLLALLATLPALAGWNFDANTRYRISCDTRDGYVCIGAYHGVNYELYYQNGTSQVEDDGWWYVEEKNGLYSIRNAETGQYLSYCTTYYDYCKYLTLTSSADSDDQWWDLTAGNYNGIDYACVASASSGYSFNLRTGTGLMGTYGQFVESSANSRFHFISEGGQEVTYSEGTGPITYTLQIYCYDTSGNYLYSYNQPFTGSYTLSTAPQINGYTYSNSTPSLPYIATGNSTVNIYYDPEKASFETSEDWPTYADSHQFANWTSNNQKQDGTTSTHTITFRCLDDTRIYFDWAVSSEKGYDRFSATLDGKTILVDKSGEDSGTYQSEKLSEGSHTLVFIYSKDSSNSSGYDQVTVTNCYLTTQQAIDITTPVQPTTITAGQFDAHTIWYRLIVRDSKLMYTSAYGVYCADIERTYAPEQLWCFTRDSQGYYTLYNMSTGAYAPLGSQDEKNATALTVESKNTITAFDLTRNGKGYNLQIPGTYTCANDYGSQGILKYWESYQAPYDGGSSIIFEEVGERTTQESIHPQSIECQSNMTIALGNTAVLQYTVLPTDATNQSVKMESNNQEVLLVANDGTLTPIAPGVATVTITSQDPFSSCSAQCFVTVVDPEAGIIMAHDGRMVYLLHQDGALTVIPRDYLEEYSTGEGTFDGTLVTDEPLHYSGIVSVSETLPLEAPTFTSYKFNNKFNPQVFDDVIAEDPSASHILLQVGGIGKRLTASFQLSDDAALAWVDGVLQDSKHTRQRFEYPVTYTLGYGHWQQLRIKEMSDGSYRHQFVPYGREVTVEVDWLCDHSTLDYDVPEIYIVTSNGTPVTSKTMYWDATMEVRGGGVFPDMAPTAMQIKGRGNTSWGGYGSKNPYRIKFPSKTAPLGMTKGKNWILLANKQNGSMTTNAIGHKIAQLMGAAAPCHIVPVELYINGIYQGSYNLCEKLGFSNNSIDLDDETELTAAMIELDTYTDETIYRSNAYGMCSKIHEPDIDEPDYTGPLTASGIIEDFDLMTRRVSMRDFDDYVDIESVASYLSTCELMINSELKHPKSVFLYSENVTDGFDPTGADPTPWIFGPLWDCDWAFGYEQSSSYYQVKAADDYYSNLLGSGTPRQFWNDLRYGSSAVDEAYYRLWHRFMTDGSFDELIEYCDDYYAFAARSLEHNYKGQYANDKSDYSIVTENCKQWLRTRARTIYSTLNVYETPRLYEPGDLNGDGDFTIADLAWLVRVLLGRQMDVYGTADVDQNGIPSFNDVNRLRDMILQRHPAE